MKKFLWLLLTVLLLTGCANQGDMEVTTDSTTVPSLTGLYIPNSEAELSTSGAVRAYDISGQRIFAVERGVAVYNDLHELVVLTGVGGDIKVTMANIGDLRLVSENTVYYYADGLYAYDWQTSQTSVWHLPQEITGDFLVSPGSREIFYCTQNQIWALHMDTGLSRLIREHSYEQQKLKAVLFNGQVLVWQTEDGVLYISTENGMTLDRQEVYYEMVTGQKDYLLYRMDGMVDQWICGQHPGKSLQLHISATRMVPDFTANGAVALDAEGVFSYYDLNSGKRTAELTLLQDQTCLDIAADGGYVWILTDQLLYRWDISKSAVADDTNYIGPLWTADEPDEEALALCRQEAKRLSDTYHISVLIGQEALAFAPDQVSVEYHAPVLANMLAELEQCLQRIPEGFMDAAVQYGGLSISLVRQVDSPRGYGRYWQAGNCNLAISAYADTEQAFFMGLGGVIETRILGNSRELEYWDDANPVGFRYSYSDKPLEEYLPYISIYFPCEVAMTYPTEDRASVFYYAMAEDAAELFASSFMQEKLVMLCEGIREAYDLKDSPEVFPWEQYLQEPLAKT